MNKQHSNGNFHCFLLSRHTFVIPRRDIVYTLPRVEALWGGTYKPRGDQSLSLAK